MSGRARLKGSLPGIALLLCSCVPTRPEGSAFVPAPVVRFAPRAPVHAATLLLQRIPSPLIVRFLDVGQGDATFISNGASKVLIDGGPDSARYGALLDSLGLNGQTIDVVVLTHPHYDHHSGLRNLFETRRHISVRYFFENGDPYTNSALRELRDSIAARATRGELAYRDTDDPCGNGAPVCTISLAGGAKLHVMRPDPNGTSPNNRSTPVKLVGPDSASFTMWFGGDAEREEIAWFDSAGYARNPGMKVNVLKEDHHGSCNGVTAQYLATISPAWTVIGVGGENSYGHVHAQTKALLSARGVSWYRTDQNWSITITVPGTAGSGYAIVPSRGAKNMDGAGDRLSNQAVCRAM